MVHTNPACKGGVQNSRKKSTSLRVQHGSMECRVHKSHTQGGKHLEFSNHDSVRPDAMPGW